MKNLLICLALVSLCACAGNPPAWWNPSGAYGVQTETALPQKRVAVKKKGIPFACGYAFCHLWVYSENVWVSCGGNGLKFPSFPLVSGFPSDALRPLPLPRLTQIF